MALSSRLSIERRVCRYVSLHVRKSNRAAFHLYTETLGYEINDIESKYYGNAPPPPPPPPPLPACPAARQR